MSERHLRLKAPGDGGHSQFIHNGCGVACSADSPDVYVSDEVAETLLETGKFEDLGTVERESDDVTESGSDEGENSDEDAPEETDDGYTRAELEAMDYTDLRQLAVDSDNPEINGRSASADIIDALATDT